MGPKRSHVTLSIAQKLKILQRLEKGDRVLNLIIKEFTTKHVASARVNEGGFVAVMLLCGTAGIRVIRRP